MKKILVPVDFSDVTEKVLENASKFAKAFESEVLILHVADPVSAAMKDKVGFQSLPAGELGDGYTATIRYDIVRDQVAHELKEEHRKILELKNKLAENEKIKVKALLIEGEIIHAIIKEIKDFKADCVVMGSHGHGPWHKALLGSVADGILRKIECPLIIIPAKK